MDSDDRDDDDVNHDDGDSSASSDIGVLWAKSKQSLHQKRQSEVNSSAPATFTAPIDSIIDLEYHSPDQELDSSNSSNNNKDQGNYDHGQHEDALPVSTPLLPSTSHTATASKGRRRRANSSVEDRLELLKQQQERSRNKTSAYSTSLDDVDDDEDDAPVIVVVGGAGSQSTPNKTKDNNNTTTISQKRPKYAEVLLSSSDEEEEEEKKAPVPVESLTPRRRTRASAALMDASLSQHAPASAQVIKAREALAALQSAQQDTSWMTAMPPPPCQALVEMNELQARQHRQRMNYAIHLTIQTHEEHFLHQHRHHQPPSSPASSSSPTSSHRRPDLVWQVLSQDTVESILKRFKDVGQYPTHTTTISLTYQNEMMRPSKTLAFYQLPTKATIHAKVIFSNLMNAHHKTASQGHRSSQGHASNTQPLAPKQEYGPPLTLTLRYPNDQGKLTQRIIKTRRKEPFSIWMEAFRQEQGASGRVVFQFDGEILSPNQTPASLDMDDEDLIDVKIS